LALLFANSVLPWYEKMGNKTGKAVLGRIHCVGAANVDRIGKFDRPAVFATSNPGAVEISAGGVARNVAVAIAALESPEGLPNLRCR
jgi:hypothetical protein